MIIPISFKLPRQHVEVIAGDFFRMWRLQMASKMKDLDGHELDDELILWATWLQTMQELDRYFAARVLSSARFEIKITISMAQVLCLYRAVMRLPLANDDHYRLLVRSTLLEHLFSFLIELPITVRPVKKQPALEQWEDYYE